MKILYIATIGGFMPFFKSLIKDLIDKGHIVDFAVNESASPIPDYYKEWGCKVYDVPLSRSPFNFGNIKAIKHIKNIAKEYDVVHCHTPLAGFATRIGCKKLRKKQGLKVIYTAHGFHFYKGAPIKNWIIYYPIEKMCSAWTDVLITINKEDYELSKKTMKSKRIEYVPGVGIDIKKFSNTKINKEEKRAQLGIPKNAYLVLSVGELNENKNHQAVIRAIANLNRQDIHYMIAGKGCKEEQLKKLASELNVNLHLLGYRNDVDELYKISDLYILPSKREGLNVSVMEALASGCPTIASRIRGNVDVLSTENLFNFDCISEISSKISRRKTCNRTDVTIFGFEAINSKIENIYFELKEGLQNVERK